MANFKKRHQPKKNHGCRLCNKSLESRNTIRSGRHTAKELLKNLENNPYFPDNDLADAIEQASKEFRKNFKLGK